MTQMNPSVWLVGAVTTIRRDPKKTGVLVVLLALLGVMAFRTFGPGPSSPTTAEAFVVGKGAGKSGLSPTAPRATAVNPQMQKWADGPVAPITRNLFAVQLEYFPVEGPRNGAAFNDRGNDGFWVRLEKSLTVHADQRDKRANQIANYKAQAAQLKLQSTMMGPMPKALVNGELVGEGDVVASFRVLKIEARRVIVEREGIRLEIQMK